MIIIVGNLLSEKSGVFSAPLFFCVGVDAVNDADQHPDLTCSPSYDGMMKSRFLQFGNYGVGAVCGAVSPLSVRPIGALILRTLTKVPVLGTEISGHLFEGLLGDRIAPVWRGGNTRKRRSW